MIGNLLGKREEKSNTSNGFYSYYDTKTGIWSRPMMAVNEHALVREVTNMLKDPQQAQNPLFMNAEDYALFQIGEFDTSTGVMTGVSTPINVANMVDIRSIIERERKAAGPGALLPT